MIETLKASDIKECIALGKEMHEESVFRNKKYVPTKLEKIGKLILLNPKVLCGFVYRKEGEIVGMFVGQIQEYYFSTDKYASDLLWFVKKEHRGGSAAYKLLRAYEKWAKENGAIETTIMQNTGVEIERTAASLSKVGYSSAGSNMRKEV